MVESTEPGDAPLYFAEAESYRKLMAAIKKVHGAIADDNCYHDIDKVFEAAGLSVPKRTVGDKFKMLKNCVRFVDVQCEGGEWESYEDVLAERNHLRANIVKVIDHHNYQLQYGSDSYHELCSALHYMVDLLKAPLKRKPDGGAIVEGT